MSSQGVVSSKEVGNNAGLYPAKGQLPSLSSQTRSQNKFLCLSLNTCKTPPNCHMLFVLPAFYLYPYILPGNPQGRFWSNKLLNSSLPCELIGIVLHGINRILSPHHVDVWILFFIPLLKNYVKKKRCVYIQHASAMCVHSAGQYSNIRNRKLSSYSYHLSFLTFGKISRKQILHYRFLKTELYSIFYCYLLFNL